MIWVALICGIVLYRLVKPFFYEEDSLLDLDTSNANSLFSVAKRLEKLYRGSRVYVGLQIPDPDSASRRNIDLVLLTNEEAVVVSVKNVSGFISVDKDGNWVCTSEKHHKTELIPNPVAESKQLVSVLEEYLEHRGVALPEEYLCFKVICPNPNFRSVQSDSFPPEIITYDQWTQLKPEQKNASSGWLKGAFLGGKKKNQESFSEKLNSVLSTSPVLDRLELKGNKYVLGEFLEFKGKRDDIHALREIKRSKVSSLTVQKISIFDFAHSTLQLLYAPRDYNSEGASWSSQMKELTVNSSTKVVFQPQNSTKVRKYKLSSVQYLAQTRKDATQVVANLQRQQVQSRLVACVYLEKNIDLMDLLITGYENTDMALHYGAMLRECIRHQSVANGNGKVQCWELRSFSTS